MQAYEKIIIRRVVGCLIPWGGLGFYRGSQSYNYKYECNLEKYKKENPKMYLSVFYAGCRGTIMYVNPIGFFLSIPSELYRLEVNLRGLKKTSRYYNVYCLFD